MHDWAASWRYPLRGIWALLLPYKEVMSVGTLRLCIHPIQRGDMRFDTVEHLGTVIALIASNCRNHVSIAYTALKTCVSGVEGFLLASRDCSVGGPLLSCMPVSDLRGPLLLCGNSKYSRTLSGVRFLWVFL